jgi:hypothetical protein
MRMTAKVRSFASWRLPAAPSSLTLRGLAALELIFAALRAGGVDEGAVATLKAAFSDD